MSKIKPEYNRNAAPLRSPLWAVSAAVALALTSSASNAQAPSQSANGSTQPAVTNDNAITPGQSQLYNASGSNGASPTSDSFKGSIVAGKNTGTVIDLPLDDAIARGLRQNLGIILQGSAVQNANGQRLEQLQQLLPTISANASIEVEQVSLAAFGIKFPGIPSVVGPFQVIDFRAYLTQSVLNLNALQTYVASKHNFASQKLTAEDARDMVVLTVGNAYLLCVADAARVTAVNAELKTSKLTYDQAVANHDAGTSPRLDVLRAQVDYQNEQQTLISTSNQLAKDKIALARAIGLPLDQQFSLTDSEPYKALDNLRCRCGVRQRPEDPQGSAGERRAGTGGGVRKEGSNRRHVSDGERPPAISAISAPHRVTRTEHLRQPALSPRRSCRSKKIAANGWRRMRSSNRRRPGSPTRPSR